MRTGWRRWFAWDHCVWLAFLGFWALQPSLDHAPWRTWLWVGVALAVFLPCYFLAHLSPRKYRWPWVLGMFILGLVYTPFNQGAWGTFIYVAAALPEVSESTNTVLTLLILEITV